MSEDAEDLEEEHPEELATEPPQQLLAEQQRVAAEELSGEEGENQQPVQQSPCSEVKEILKTWTGLQTLVDNMHPDREKATAAFRCLMAVS